MTMPEQKKAVVPRLRFPEFRNAGPWEVKQLGELIETVTPSKKLQTADYLSEGRYPIIDQSLAPIAGWTDDESAVIREHLPLILFGDHTCVIKIVSVPFCQGADGIKILATKREVDPYFLYEFLLAFPIQQKEYRRHFSILKQKAVRFPKIQTGEQQKIADCLSSLDELIELQAKKLEALQAHKKGLMQQLFPREGETTPRLRFPEFRDAGPWEVKRLGDVLDVRNMRRTASPEVPLFSLTIEQGITEKTDRYNREFLVIDRSNKRYKLVLPGDIVYNPANLRWGAIAVSKVPYPIVVSPIYEVLCPKKHISICHDFIGIALMLPQQISRFASKGQGTLVERIAVKVEDFLDTLIAIPAQIEEQQKIADCLSSLNELIELQAKQLEALKAHKKGLMQQLFPQEIDL